MSVRVQQLNADSTFLLTFFPSFAPKKLSPRLPGDFTILLDPWLQGHASMLHPAFQISHHTSTPALHSLQHLPQLPDIILISQDKPDHCHRETLCSLPRTSDTAILATPAAAKRIRSWGHFDKEQVHVIPTYNPLDEETVVRIPLPSYSSTSKVGEITITNIPTKRDVAGLHNAICITYQPSSSVLTASRPPRQYPNSSSSVVLSDDGIPGSPDSRRRSRTSSSAPRPNFLDPLGVTQSLSSLHLSRADSGTAPPPPTLSPDANQEQVLSIIYTPHGVSPSTLRPYISNHLAPLDALPVSLLFHGLTTAENPWYMGGRVANGAPGGVQIAEQFGVRHWIRAHDEEKINKGVATLLTKMRPYGPEKVEAVLRHEGIFDTKVHELDVGGVIRIPELDGQGEKGSRINEGADKGLTLGKGQRMNWEDNVLAMPEPVLDRPLTAPAVGAADLAPGTQMRIRREITHPDGIWI